MTSRRSHIFQCSRLPLFPSMLRALYGMCFPRLIGPTTFRENGAWWGGAIYNDESVTTFPDDTVFEDNTADAVRNYFWHPCVPLVSSFFLGGIDDTKHFCTNRRIPRRGSRQMMVPVVLMVWVVRYSHMAIQTRFARTNTTDHLGSLSGTCKSPYFDFELIAGTCVALMKIAIIGLYSSGIAARIDRVSLVPIQKPRQCNYVPHFPTRGVQ